MFDYLVIGKGMIGSAAARYLSAQSASVALVGPDEPQNWRTHDGVFSSHYDQGRITRILGPELVWSQLAKRAMAAYADIERQSGVRFHHAVGGVRANVSAETSAKIRQIGEELGAAFAVISAENLNQQHPYFAFPTSTHLMLEHGLAGYINPRSLVAAQIAIAKQQGANVITETVTSLSQKHNYVEVATDAGATYQAKKALICAGAYTNMLLPDKPLAVRRKAHMVLRAEINSAEQARLAKMPTLIYELPAGSAMRSLYMLPPVQYPDGRVYIKLGGTTHWPDRIFSDWQEIVAWFQSDGDPQEAEALRSVLHQTLPNLKVERYLTKPCILTYTEHGNAIVDQINDHLYVAAGGCGSAAKSSDAIGELAARCVQGQAWPNEFKRTDFQAVYA